MLMPKRQKYRKVRKGKIRGVATAGNYIAFGDYALQAQGQDRITARQIEAARQAMTRHIKRGGKIWIRIFPHISVTRKPQDVKMGSVTRSTRTQRTRPAYSRGAPPLLLFVAASLALHGAASIALRTACGAKAMRDALP